MQDWSFLSIEKASGWTKHCLMEKEICASQCALVTGQIEEEGRSYETHRVTYACYYDNQNRITYFS